MTKNRRRTLMALGTIVLQMILVRWVASYPAFIEKYYTLGVYPHIAEVQRFFVGWLPFSFGDLVYSVCVVLLVRYVFAFAKAIIHHKKPSYKIPSKNWKHKCYSLLVGINVVYALFHLSWGLNYYRQPMHRIVGVEENYTTEELDQLVKKLMRRTNELHAELQPQDSLKVSFDRTQSELFKVAQTAYQYNPEPAIQTTFSYQSTKKSLITPVLSYMGYGGYLNPATGEAQVNGWINTYKTPVLILHEMAHQIGFAKENEANFAAITTGLNHPDKYFKLSSLMFALRYCLNDLYRRDPKLYKKRIPDLRYGVRLNYKEQEDFWKKYEGVIEDAFTVTYDKFLKANNQPKGMRTYSYVVALLVNYAGQGKGI